MLLVEYLEVLYVFYNFYSMTVKGWASGAVQKVCNIGGWINNGNNAGPISSYNRRPRTYSAWAMGALL